MEPSGEDLIRIVTSGFASGEAGGFHTQFSHAQFSHSGVTSANIFFNFCYWPFSRIIISSKTFRNIPKVSEIFDDRSLINVILTHGFTSVMSLRQFWSIK